METIYLYTYSAHPIKRYVDQQGLSYRVLKQPYSRSSLFCGILHCSLTAVERKSFNSHTLSSLKTQDNNRKRCKIMSNESFLTTCSMFCAMDRNSLESLCRYSGIKSVWAKRNSPAKYTRLLFSGCTATESITRPTLRTV